MQIAVWTFCFLGSWFSIGCQPWFSLLACTRESMSKSIQNFSLQRRVSKCIAQVRKSLFSSFFFFFLGGWGMRLYLKTDCLVLNTPVTNCTINKKNWWSHLGDGKPCVEIIVSMLLQWEKHSMDAQMNLGHAHQFLNLALGTNHY